MTDPVSVSAHPRTGNTGTPPPQRRSNWSGRLIAGIIVAIMLIGGIVFLAWYFQPADESPAAEPINRVQQAYVTAAQRAHTKGYDGIARSMDDLKLVDPALAADLATFVTVEPANYDEARLNDRIARAVPDPIQRAELSKRIAATRIDYQLWSNEAKYVWEQLTAAGQTVWFDQRLSLNLGGTPNPVTGVVEQPLVISGDNLTRLMQEPGFGTRNTMANLLLWRFDPDSPADPQLFDDHRQRKFTNWVLRR